MPCLSGGDHIPHFLKKGVIMNTTTKDMGAFPYHLSATIAGSTFKSRVNVNNFIIDISNDNRLINLFNGGDQTLVSLSQAGSSQGAGNLLGYTPGQFGLLYREGPAFICI